LVERENKKSGTRPRGILANTRLPPASRRKNSETASRVEDQLQAKPHAGMRILQCYRQ
jgi:hypothetical protein